MNNLGEKIKELRIKNNMTQQDLGDKLYVSDKPISSYESNRTTPDIDMLLKICNTLNTNLMYLLSSSSNESYETEIKLKTNKKEYERILNLIKDKSTYIGKEEHKAIYFNTDNGEYLRIRKENDKNILNFKKTHDKYCDEYEVSIDNIDNMIKIFNCLNYKEVAQINKTRIKYLYKNKYEFSFDNVENLGLFVEIEVKKYNSTPEKEYHELIKLLYELNIDINLIDNKRYLDYFIKK